MTASDIGIALDPVIDRRTKILILGSLPGRVSLAERRYYAHPQNQFWRLIGGAIGIELVSLAYAERLERLLGAGVGLWDVIEMATRRGSLDSAIHDARPRDLASFVARHPGLRALAFNGATAFRIGVRQFGRASPRPLLNLPSSSAAHTIGMAAKQIQWNLLRQHLGEPDHRLPRISSESADLRYAIATTSTTSIRRARRSISMAAQPAESPHFTNATDLVFTDISSEIWREYRFVGGDTVRVTRPLKLHVSESGGHRIFDAEGVSHYIPKGWIHLMWTVEDGAPNFVK